MNQHMILKSVLRAALLVCAIQAVPARATYFIAQYVPPTPPGSVGVPSSSSSPTSALPPGLYVQVLDGAISVANGGGTANFAAGQFGYTPSFTQPPVLVPTNPGMQFTPPPTFSSSVPGSSASSGAKPGNVDCIVR